MKQNVRRALAISGIAVVIGTTGLVYGASANVNKSAGTTHRNAVATRNIARKTAVRTLKGRGLAANKLNTRAHKRLIPGFVTAVSDNSLEIKQGNKTYTVEVASTTRILGLKWNKISLSDIKTNDKVSVLGTVSADGKIAAQTVRDITQGKTAATSATTSSNETAQ